MNTLGARRKRKRSRSEFSRGRRMMCLGMGCEMRPLLACAGVMLLVSCAAPPRPSPPPTDRTDTSAITKQLQDNWNRCLEQSYQITRTQTPDNNAAAEMTFQACSSEERDLASLPYANLLMPHLKSQTKRVLIDEGHLTEPHPQ